MCYYVVHEYKHSDLQTYSKQDLKKSFCMNPVSQCGSGQSSKPTRQEHAHSQQISHVKIVFGWQSYVGWTQNRNLTACRAENHQIAQQNVS